MRLNQLEYFVAIDKYGSFSKAAEALYIAQPSISRAIKDLETEEKRGYEDPYAENTDDELDLQEMEDELLDEVDLEESELDTEEKMI